MKYFFEAPEDEDPQDYAAEQEYAAEPEEEEFEEEEAEPDYDTGTDDDEFIGELLNGGYTEEEQQYKQYQKYRGHAESSARNSGISSAAAKETYDYYVNEKGLKPHVAAGIVGNMQQESGFDPQANGDHGTSHGLMQWRNERWHGLQQAAHRAGKSPYDIGFQRDYVLSEPGESARMLQRANNSRGAADAARSIGRTYERYNPAAANESGRAATAESLMRQEGGAAGAGMLEGALGGIVTGIGGQVVNYALESILNPDAKRKAGVQNYLQQEAALGQDQQQQLEQMKQQQAVQYGQQGVAVADSFHKPWTKQSQTPIRKIPQGQNYDARGFLQMADVATDVMQMGNFIPHPVAQGIARIGNALGPVVDAYQTYDSFKQGDTVGGLINAASVVLPAGLEMARFARNSKYLLPGAVRSTYLPLDKAYKGMTQGNLAANRGLAAGLAAETAYDSKQQGGSSFADLRAFKPVQNGVATLTAGTATAYKQGQLNQYGFGSKNLSDPASGMWQDGISNYMKKEGHNVMNQAYTNDQPLKAAVAGTSAASAAKGAPQLSVPDSWISSLFGDNGPGLAVQAAGALAANGLARKQRAIEYEQLANQLYVKPRMNKGMTGIGQPAYAQHGLRKYYL